MVEIKNEDYQKFEEYIKEYTDKNYISEVDFDHEVSIILNLKLEDIQKLDDEDCLAKAYQLTSFCLYLQTEQNENTVKLDWCHDVLNDIIAKSYNNFDKYMKAEVKKAAIINDNEFAKSVDKLRQYLQLRVTLLKDKIDDIRNMAKLLEQISKRKSFR